MRNWRRCGLRFAPDISTASRATIGGMMANNSSGARSVLYGKTIDHVLEQTVLLSDGSIAHFRDIPRGEVPAAIRWRPLVISTVLRLAPEHAAEIDRRYPKILRRVGGYNLDEFTDAAQARESGEDDRGLRRHAGNRSRSETEAGSAAESEGRDGHHVRRSAGIALGRAGDSATRPVRGRGDGQVHSRLHATERRRSTASAARSFEGDPAATLCVEFYGDRKEDLPPRLRALEEDLRSRNLGYAYRIGDGPRGAGTHLEPARGVARPFDGDEGDAKSISFVEDTAVAPEKLRDFIDRFLAIVRATEPRRASMRMLPSDACTCGP